MKIFTTNKKIIVSYFLIFFSIIFSVMIGIFAVENISLDKPLIEKKLIIIDPGHGGEDGGAVVEHEKGKPIIEKDINLKISLKLRSLLRTYGHQVVMTREKDESIYDPNSVTLRQKKRSDLNNRKKIIEQHSGSKNTVLISIHQNKFTEEKYEGTQIFYSTNNPDSKVLAESLKESITSKLQPENKREIKPSTSKIFILNESKIPSVNIECGFLSNESDAKKLTTDEYQSYMAMSVFCGLFNYFIER